MIPRVAARAQPARGFTGAVYPWTVWNAGYGIWDAGMWDAGLGLYGVSPQVFRIERKGCGKRPIASVPAAQITTVAVSA